MKYELERLNATEFCAFFEKLKQHEKNDFVILNRSDIILVEDADKLRVLCKYGYMMALIPLINLVDDDEIFDWYKKLYPRSNDSHLPIALTFEEEVMLLHYAGQHVEIAKYLCESTELFFDHKQKTVPYRKILYSRSSDEVFETFFRFMISKHIAMCITSADIFFKRASKSLIEDYTKRIGRFNHKTNSFSSRMAHILYEREDLEVEEKDELFWLIIRHFNIKRSAIYLLKKDGFIK